MSTPTSSSQQRTGLEAQVDELARGAKAASRAIAQASTETKNAALLRAAELIEGPARQAIMTANAKDLEAAKAKGLKSSLVDRLSLANGRLEGVAKGLRDVAALPDPVGVLSDERVLDNGLKVSRVTAPIGVIAIIYESRPNVTADAAALCIKSGNAVILRGGSEAFESNQALGRVIAQALEDVGLPKEVATLVATKEREASRLLLQRDDLVDVVIPRGGEGLIEFVSKTARMSVIKHYKGVCHVYVAADADLEMAARIVDNAKTHRPGVCNALETLLVDQAVAETFVPGLVKWAADKDVELRGDARSVELGVGRAAEASDWDAEYLDLVLAVRVVSDADAAIEHVAKHGSNHTEAIVTSDEALGQRWVREVDASLVLVNASTRFNDGGQLGLGAEMGISTTKLHAYGPMGLAELCTRKWVGLGSGQIRQ